MRLCSLCFLAVQFIFSFWKILFQFAQEVDIAFGSITQSYEREMAADFSYPYDSTATGIVSKKPGLNISIMALLRPFQPPVWAAIVVAFVSFFPTYWISNYSVQQNTRISLNTALFQSIQCILMQGNYSPWLLGLYKVAWTLSRCQRVRGSKDLGDNATCVFLKLRTT